MEQDQVRMPSAGTKQVTPEVVTELFEGLLERLPEPAAIGTFMCMESIAEAARAIAASPEFNAKRRGSPFFHYKSCFDPEALMYKYAVPQPEARPGLYVNFLGVAIAPRFLPKVLGETDGCVEGMPIPANWHADIAEWGAVLRAIDLAKSTFTMAELGCGWGCWINNSCVTAKRAGLRVHGIGVEGDSEHIGFARDASELNGLMPGEVTLHHAIASGIDGVALFPKQEHGGHDWGLKAVFNATPEQRESTKLRGTHTELPTMSLSKVAGGRKLDLLHIDIQGAEVDVVRNSIDFLAGNVAYMMIGTHSRQIEGELVELLCNRGWLLEIERPAIAELRNGKPVVVVDGVQGWRNPKLT